MSSDQAKAYHSITIGTKNTWDDWHLVPTSRPLVETPGVKTHFVDIPGGDGQLDLTTALTGRPLYGNRSGSWTFLVMNGYQSWEVLYSNILNYLHGQQFRAVLDDDPGYYYEGRFSVAEWQSQKDWSRIIINYILGPYKYTIAGISGYNDLAISGNTNITVTVDKVGVVSDIITSAAGMTLNWKGTTYNLSKGSNKLSRIKLGPGTNVLSFTGSGTVSLVVNKGQF